MTPRRWPLIVLTVFYALRAQAQQTCPCVPIAREWIVSACESWNCAAAAMVMANGNPDVLSLPSGSDDFKWVVIRAVPVGSAIAAPDEPFKVETFSDLTTAMDHFQSINPDYRPFLFTLPDGHVLVVLRSTPHPRRHVAGR